MSNPAAGGNSGGVAVVNLIATDSANSAAKSLCGWIEHAGLEPQRSSPIALPLEAGASSVVIVDLTGIEKLAAVDLERLGRWLGSFNGALLLVASSDHATVQRVIREATQGVVEGLCRLRTGRTVRFPQTCRPDDIDLSPFEFGAGQGRALGLELSSSADVLMTVNGVPCFVRQRTKQGSLYVWAADSVLDPSTPIHDEVQLECCIDSYLPALLFLRATLGKHCWHNPQPTAAIVIDDPLVRLRYGSIDFPSLLESARRCGYRVTVAHIPWNSDRIRRQAAHCLVAFDDVFGLCVHGCDHTRHEFDSPQIDDLRQRSQSALDQTLGIEAMWGLRADPVMVFPQERFSVAAVRALAETGTYLGATNTRAIPTSDFEEPVTASDLLAPAQDALYGVALVKRHYLTNMGSFAMSLVVGRPAIMAAHHGDFAAGVGCAESFAGNIRCLAPSVKWLPLGELFRTLHQRRMLLTGDVEVRFFTPHFTLTHSTASPVSYRLRRRVPETMRVDAVTVDGRAVAFWRDGSYLKFDLHCDVPCQRDIRIVSLEAVPVLARREPGARMFVAGRRWLSEWRDEGVAAAQRWRRGWAVGYKAKDVAQRAVSHDGSRELDK